MTCYGFVRRLFLFFVTCTLLTSCASIIHGRRQEVTVSSNPTGVTVTDGVNSWVTPAKISLPRKTAHMLTFFKPGYRPQIVRLERTVSGAVFGNIIIPFGLVGWGIDAISGAQWKLLPEMVDVTMMPERGELPVAIEEFKQKIAPSHSS